jgi:hypothetical protein
MSVVSTAKIVEDYAQQLGDWWYNNLDAEQAYLKSIGPTNYRTSSPGWSDVLKLLVVVIVTDKTRRFRLPPMVRVYVEMKPREGVRHECR